MKRSVVEQKKHLDKANQESSAVGELRAELARRIAAYARRSGEHTTPVPGLILPANEYYCVLSRYIRAESERLRPGTEAGDARRNSLLVRRIDSDHSLRVLVVGFRIPASVSIGAPMAQGKVAPRQSRGRDGQGHPKSVLYKLLIGLHTGKRDLIDAAYVMDSFFWMDFAPGGMNWPQYHPAAEEIDLVADGQGDIVAGSGENGVEGRYAASTVGFYNQDEPDAKACILAVRTRVPLHEDDE